MLGVGITESHTLPQQQAADYLSDVESSMLHPLEMNPMYKVARACVDFIWLAKMVVLTATLSNHWMELPDAIASVQNIVPDMTIVVLDLGISNKQAEQLQDYAMLEFRSSHLTVFHFSTSCAETGVFV